MHPRWLFGISEPSTVLKKSVFYGFVTEKVHVHTKWKQKQSHLCIISTDPTNDGQHVKNEKCLLSYAITLSETNIALENLDGWNTIVSFWGPAYLQGLLLLVSGRVLWVFSNYSTSRK